MKGGSRPGAGRKPKIRRGEEDARPLSVEQARTYPRPSLPEYLRGVADKRVRVGEKPEA